MKLEVTIPRISKRDRDSIVRWLANRDAVEQPTEYSYWRNLQTKQSTWKILTNWHNTKDANIRIFVDGVAEFKAIGRPSKVFNINNKTNKDFIFSEIFNSNEYCYIVQDELYGLTVVPLNKMHAYWRFKNA